jgi:hypothetical protein
MLKPRRTATLLALLALALTAPAAHAQGDLKTPYRLRVVLHVARHRLLTDIFRQRLERELGDGLQGALGELGEVQVVSEHPKLAEVLRDGLQRALDVWDERSDVKTHFVLVDYSGGYIEIQARQHDGLTGRSSPVVRYDRTRDRAFVAKAAALLIKQDFGLVGTVQGDPEGAKGAQGRLVKVELRGGGLDVPWGRWVRPGDVFALVQAPPGGGTSRPILWAFVQVKDAPADGAGDGLCTCRLFHRYELPQAAGLRCIQLGTVRAPLRLKFLREVPGPDGRPRLLPLQGTLSVEPRRHGFTGEEGIARIPTDRTGAIDTGREGERGLFDHVAFVSVYLGTEKKAQVPVALVADRQAVVEIALGARDAGTEVALKAMSWQREVADSYLVQVQLFKDINAVTVKPDQLASALERVRKALDRSREDRARLAADHDALVAQIARLPPRSRPNLAASERLLTELETGENQLRKHFKQLEDSLREVTDPQRIDWLARVKQGQLLEEDFEVGKAIKVYEKVLAEGFKNEELSKHLEEIRKKWEPKDEPHKDARQFIYYVWPTLDNAGLKANLGKAEEALSVCRRVDDTYGAGRLFRATVAHAVRMEKEANALKPQINIDDEKPAELIKELTPGLNKLAADIKKFLDSKQPAD